MTEAYNSRPGSGFLNVLKPPGMTSHDVVGFLRKALSQKKAGHCGTLDPGAAGVLPVALGHATRLIEYLPHDIKKYRAEILLGITTDTGDTFGAVTMTRPVRALSQAEVKRVLEAFLGVTSQRPPAASAIRIRGKRLYEYHRQGEQVEIPVRQVRIDSIAIAYMKADRLMLDVVCGGGTYIRSLAHDIGEMLGCGATMSFLVRTGSGPFGIAESITLDEIVSSFREGAFNRTLIRPGDALNHLPSLALDGEEERMLRNGVTLYGDFGAAIGPEKTMVQVTDTGGEMIAVAEICRGEREALRPLKVMPQP
jgi:tRNA pseudouridine55 synthase